METGTRATSLAERISPVILHVGINALLLAIRSDVLERTGFTVLSVKNLDDVESALCNNPRGLMVLCHSLSVSQRTVILSKLDQQQGVTGLLVINEISTIPPDTDGVETIQTSDGPRALVLRATKLLSAN